jgi:glycosyltransferase involved in cell wall biosynthesis
VAACLSLTVFFDAAQAALWEASTIHRTGVGRAAVGLLRAFAERDDIRLVPACPAGMEGQAALFMHNHSWTRNAVFPYDTPPSRKASLLARCKSAAGAILRRLPPIGQGAIRRISGMYPFAAYDRENPRLVALVREYMRRPGRAVWFSPYQPVPRALAAIPMLQKHVLLHDIIPLRFPDEHPSASYYLEMLRAHRQRADCIWTNSAFTRADVLEYLPDLDAGKVHVAHLGGGEHFTPASAEEIAEARRQCALPPDVPFLCCLATLEPRKGLTDAVRAFAALSAELPEMGLHLVLTGQKGWQYAAVLAAAREHADRIRLPGFVQDETVRRLLSGCMCFLYPSRYEGFGLPLVEAMACGAPVITSNAASIPEVAGEAALQVPPGDVAALMKALRLVCVDRELRRRLREAGLERAKRFSWTRCAETMVQGMLQAPDVMI